MKDELSNQSVESRARRILRGGRLQESEFSSDGAFLDEFRRRLRNMSPESPSWSELVGSLGWKAAPVWGTVILVFFLALFSFTSSSNWAQPTDQLFWTLAGTTSPDVTDSLILSAVVESAEAGR